MLSTTQAGAAGINKRQRSRTQSMFGPADGVGGRPEIKRSPPAEPTSSLAGSDFGTTPETHSPSAEYIFFSFRI